jgi:Tfp pilus assembly protein PilO
MTLSFRNSEETSLSLVILCSIVVLAGCLGYYVFGPKVDVKAAQKNRAKMTDQLYDQAKTAEANVKQETAIVKQRLWNMPAEEVGPVAMQKVGEIALLNHVKVQSFRPSRITDAGGLEQVPFQVVINGVYPNVIAFTRALERSPAHFAVNQVSMSAGDGNTDNVAATISIIAFRTANGGPSGQS